MSTVTKKNIKPLLNDFWKKYNTTIISFLGLITVIVVFAILTNGKLLTKKPIRTIINQSVITAIIATGSVFLFSLGMIDLSLGSTCAVAAIASVQIANHFNNSLIPLVLSCIVVSILVLSFNGFIIGVTKLPSFIVTLVMMNVLSSLAKLIMPSGMDDVSMPRSATKVLDQTWFMILCLVLVVFACVIIFNYTPHGRRSKVLGGNRVNANLSGINFLKTTFISYAICGICVGIGAFLLVIRNSGASYSTGNQIGFDVIICLVLGAMPISGGVKSRISAGVIGSFTIVILDNGLSMAHVPSAFVQIIKAVVFLTIVTLLLYKDRTKLLA